MTGSLLTHLPLTSWCGLNEECGYDPPCDVHQLLHEHLNLRDVAESALFNLSAAQGERTHGLTASAAFIDSRIDNAVMYLRRGLIGGN